jgi:hypothetical protein
LPVGTSRHERDTVDVDALPFPVQPPLRLGVPSLAGRLAYELAVDQVHRIGSHVPFATRVEPHDDLRGNQPAHVSTGYVEWAARRGRQIAAARSDGGGDRWGGDRSRG